MDDDLSFGASIWASSSSEPPSKETKSSIAEPSFPAFKPPSHADTSFRSEAFDDNDFDFDAPVQATTTANEDDDFGDFGDFGETVDGDALGGFSQPTTFAEEDAVTSPYETEWKALQLDPLPSTSGLKDGIGDILQPLWSTLDASEFLTDDDIRQVGGLNQILVTAERCRAFNQRIGFLHILTIDLVAPCIKHCTNLPLPILRHQTGRARGYDGGTLSHLGYL